MRLPMISNVAGVIPVTIGAGLATQRRGRAELFQMATESKPQRGAIFSDEREAVIVHYDIELDDAELDPYQFRTYQRIARRCAGATAGQCFESLDAMAQGCKMSRPTLIRAIKVLIQRGMIRRLSRQGFTSYYALADKKNWISFEAWEKLYSKQPGKPQTHPPGKPESQGVVNQRARGGKPESQGGGSHVYTKNTHEEYKKEREKPALSVEKSIASILVTAYKNIATDYRDQTALQSQIITLESGRYSAVDVEAWLSSKNGLSSINFISRDFKTWLENRVRKNSNSTSSDTKTHYADGREKPKHLQGFVY